MSTKKRKQKRSIMCMQNYFQSNQIVALLVAAGVLCALTLSPMGWAAVKDVDDEDITNAVETELWGDNAVDSNNIDVVTNEGIVTFTGSVDSILAEERAKKIASTTVGVHGVVSRLKIAPDVARSDKDVETAVETALLADSATELYEVNVDVKNGVVTLTGTVDSYQESQLCGTVAKGVRGVRGLNNQIDVNYKTDRPDIEIKEEVEACLKNDVRVDDFLITVMVADGEVTLTGTVGSLAEKNRAIADAWCSGVSQVNAEGLEIKYWARDEMRRKNLYTSQTDEAIKEAVENAFLYDPRVLSFNPRVSVENGTVSLSGVVNNLEAKRAAEADARNIIGVWRVKNNLKVRPTTTPDDNEIEQEVRNALAENPYVESYEIDVDVSYGWVTLSGDVNTFFEKRQAELAAEGVKGVTRVFNNIEYQYEWTWKPDWEIKADVEDQLWWSPFVDKDEVTVTVNNGVVTLTGTVDTWSERQDAEENAYEGGAKDVNNNLVVTYDYYGPQNYYGPYYWNYPVYN